MLDAVGTICVVGRENCLAFVGGERPTPGPVSESEQRLEVLLLCGNLGCEKGFRLPFDLFLELLDVEEHDLPPLFGLR